MKRILTALLAFTMLLSLAACGEQKEPEGPAIDVATLTDSTLTYSAAELAELSEAGLSVHSYEAPQLYKYYDGLMKIGCSFGADQINNLEGEEATGLLKQYNVLVLGNEFKPSYVNPSEGVFNFEWADEFVEFAEISGAETRGHTLVWHSQVPDWWFKADPTDTRTPKECYEQGALATREQLIERIETYITTVVSRYKGQVDYWDVCNEVLNADSIRNAQEDDSYWAEIIGDVDGNGYADDYVEIAFNAARAADPDAVLIINDFNMEWQKSKTQAMYDMVERMLRKGVRIDGIGFQSHISLDCNVELYRTQIAKLAELSAVYDECFPEYAGNFRIQITELDMNMFIGANSEGSYYKWSDEEFEKQAAKYAELFEMFTDFAEEGVIDMVVFWGTDDENSWLNSTPKLRRNAAMIIDRPENNYALKPAYWSVAEVGLNRNK